MLEKRITVDAATVGKWVPLNRRSFGTVGFTVKPQIGTAGGTYSVQFTESEIQRGTKVVGLSRVTTVLTIPLVNHGLSTNDDVIITKSADYDGVYRVASVVDADTITVTVADAGQTSPRGDIIPVVVDDLTDFSAVSGLLSGNISASVVAVRLNNAAEPTIKHDILINQFES